MTREVLEKKLKIAGIPDYIYNLTGQGKNDECLCLEKIQDKWSVYYLERGIKTTNEIFDSENDACQFLYDQLMSQGLDADQMEAAIQATIKMLNLIEDKELNIQNN